MASPTSQKKALQINVDAKRYGTFAEIGAGQEENRRIEGLENYDPLILQIDTRDVLARLQRGDASWESAVPERVAAIIKERRLFEEHAT